ncbi:MAG: hypothetical protein R2854_25550 [Caldilineaceae bacterium]
MITYGNDFFAAKELTVLPGRTAVIKDSGPYGFITIQGHGTINGQPLETPALIRFGQLTYDEYFVAAGPARLASPFTTRAPAIPVMLQHFGPTPEALQK